jgi:hypothetical protein
VNAQAVPLIDVAWSLPASAARLVSVGFGDRDHGLREMANKVRAYERFLSAPDVGPAGLTAALAGLDDWEATWVKEGVGFRWATRRAAGDQPLDSTTLPADWRLPLHTGVGLGLALRTLDVLSWRPERDELEAVVEDFVRRASARAGEGWRLAVLEALGLIAGTLHPHRLAGLDAATGAVATELRRAFWHGVGRGHYFAPTAALPFFAGSAARRLAELAAAAPDGEAREQAVSGWAWALALVNVRHPEVVASALCDADGPASSPAFADGVACALTVWLACGGHQERVERFLAHRPAAGREARWSRLVAACEEAWSRAPAVGEPLGDLFVHRAGRWRGVVPSRQTMRAVEVSG